MSNGETPLDGIRHGRIAMPTYFDFEQPLVELQEKISAIRQFGKLHDVDVTHGVSGLNTIYSVITLEGCADILWRSNDAIPKAAPLLKQSILNQLLELQKLTPEQLRDDRYNRFRRFGRFEE